MGMSGSLPHAIFLSKSKGATLTLPSSVNNGGLVTGTFVNGDGYASGFVRLFGYLHEVNAGFWVTNVYDGNDHNRIVGRAFDFRRNRVVGYIGDLPIKNHDNRG